MTKIQTKPMAHHHLPITYHSVLEESFGDWARTMGLMPALLRKVSELAIRRSHHEAFIEDESREARGRQPDIFTLWIDPFKLYYTIEPHAVVIRGYGWDIKGEPLDDFDGGGLYCEYEWSLPPDAK